MALPPVCTCSYRVGESAPGIALLKFSIEDNPENWPKSRWQSVVKQSGPVSGGERRIDPPPPIDSIRLRSRDCWIRFFFLCVHALLRACCARQWSFRCCCCYSGCGKLTPRVPAPLRFFLLPSFLSFVFTLPRVVRGKSDFAPIFFLSRGKYFRRKYSLLDSNEFFGEESY